MISAKSINDVYIQIWSYWKDFFSFPLKAKIGGTGVTKIFKEETEFLNFLSTDDSAFMWRGHEDFSVLCNMYQFKIRIYKEGSSEPTVIEPSIGNSCYLCYWKCNCYNPT